MHSFTDSNNSGLTVMKKSLVLLALAACAVLGGPRSAEATVITFDATQVSGTTWMYAYEVDNTSATAIDEFTIFFDRNLFANLFAVPGPAGWDPFVAQPDFGLPADGFYDALAGFGFSLAAGTTLAGFSVQFDFLGLGTPGSQAFDIIGLDPFGTVESGRTQSRAVRVSEPGSLALLALGVLVLAGSLSQRRRRARGHA